MWSDTGASLKGRHSLQVSSSSRPECVRHVWHCTRGRVAAALLAAAGSTALAWASQDALRDPPMQQADALRIRGGIAADMQGNVRKVPVDPAMQKPQILRGDLMGQPVTPAPEVLRLWSPEVLSTVKISAKVRAAVAALDSTEFQERREASSALMDASVAPEQLFATLDREQLSTEQRERLLAAAREKVLALPRGALGIRMQPSGDPQRPGVEIIMLLPGMPASAVLKVGDRIEEIDGKSVTNSNDLVDLIQSRLPGDTVKLRVARPERDERGRPRLDGQGGFVEQRLNVDMQLTTAADLDKFEGQFPSMSRSLVLERRLLALQQAEERFAPKPIAVRRRGPEEPVDLDVPGAP